MGLSQQAAKASNKTIIMCGVRFMAETVKIFSHQIKRSYLPLQKQDVQWLIKLMQIGFAS